MDLNEFHQEPLLGHEAYPTHSDLETILMDLFKSLELEALTEEELNQINENGCLIQVLKDVSPELAQVLYDEDWLQTFALQKLDELCKKELPSLVFIKQQLINNI